MKLRQFSLRKHRKAKITWLGLDKAGKSTLIRRVIHGVFDSESSRTMGLNVDKIIIESDESLELVSWDLGGQIYFRSSLWKSYMENTNGVIFVVDAADPKRFPEAKMEIWNFIFNQRELDNVPVLVLANKQDLDEAVDSGTLVRSLELEKVQHRSFILYPVSAKTAHNLTEAMDWLYERIIKNVQDKKANLE
ncbi:MAG: ADP-ribosylation factor family protein [Candidatus Hodarchaeales archaeon]